MQRWALVIGLLVLLSVTPAAAAPLPGTAVFQAPTPTPPATDTATPVSSPSPTAIAAVELGLSGIITTTRQLALDQVSAWEPSSDSGPLFLGLAALIFTFGLLTFIKAILAWRARPAVDE